MAANMLTLMDVMPSAADRINMDQAARQQQEQNQYQTAVLAQAQQQAMGQNALTQAPQGQAPQGQQPPSQNALMQPPPPQGQAPNPPQGESQMPIPQNYAEAVAQAEQVQREQAQKAQWGTETKQVQELFMPAVKQAEEYENPELMNSYADAMEKMYPANPQVKQAAALTRNNKISKGVVTVSPTQVTDPDFAKAQFELNKPYLQSIGIMNPEELMGKSISFDQSIKTRAQVPGSLKVVPPTKEELADTRELKKIKAATDLETQRDKARLELETHKEEARAREDDKKQRAAELRFEGQQRQAERRQEHADSRFAQQMNRRDQQLNLREFNSSAQPAKTALGTAYRTSNAASGFENKIKTNVGILNNWMDSYVKKHPGAANRTGAVFNDLINGKITGEGDLSNIKTAADSVGFELGKLESGSYGTAGATRNATEHFNQLKTTKGLDNMRTQLRGITTLAESAKASQDAVTKQAEETLNDVRTQYGLPPTGKAGKTSTSPPTRPSTYKIGAPYKAPGQNTKQIIGVHREGGKVTKLMLSDKSVVEVQ